MSAKSRVRALPWLVAALLPLPTAAQAEDRLPAPLPAPPPSVSADPGSALIPGQEIVPIDLAGVLRLAGARDLDVAIARARVCQSVAELEQAKVLWLPSLYLGPNWIRHDGQAQIVQGPVQTISKSSLFLGATAASGSSVSGPIPAGGPAQVTGLTSILRISDAIFIPRAASRVVDSRKAGVQAVTNLAILEAAEAYFDLQRAAGRLALAKEAAKHSEDLSILTAAFAKRGAGLEADHQRCLAERDKRRSEVEAAVGEFETAATEVVRRTRLSPTIVPAPIEPPEAAIRLVDDGAVLDDLVVQGLRNRPELAQYQALVEATLVRLKQARMRPFIPSVALRYSGGGFGGGTNAFFGAFASRSDADVNLFWELQNLGFADRAIVKQREAEKRAAVLELMKLQDRVAAEVVRAEKFRIAAARRMHESGKAIPEALASLELNFTNIRKGTGLPSSTRPIEVLQPIQALAQARLDYLTAVLDYNRAQFRLYHALGYPGTNAPAMIR